jgi:HSP20 family protein
MSQAYWSQIRDLMDLQQRMNRLLDHSLERREAEGDHELERGQDWTPLTDIYETKNEIVLKLEIPEMAQRDIEVRVDENRLVVSGERRLSEEAKREEYRRIERSYGRFARSFTLPETIDREGIEAAYKDGVLRLMLPKREERRAKPITIQVK